MLIVGKPLPRGDGGGVGDGGGNGAGTEEEEVLEEKEEVAVGVAKSVGDRGVTPIVE